ncbi:MAG: cation:proton antiporter [Acidimicrobiia bacterium]|nr:cation:proton antiporter [Acidimicrobiia bacterium]
MNLLAFAAAGGEGGIASATVLILIGAAAFSLPLIAGRFRVPAIVLEILFGLVIGPEILGIVSLESIDAEFIEVLAELGLFLLMFLAGFEVDFERLERQGVGPVAFALLVIGLSAGIGWFLFGLTADTIEQQVFLTLLTAAASLGIVVPALRSTRRSSTALGQSTIVIAVLAEFLSTALIVIFGVYVNSGFGVGLLRVPALFVIMWVLLLLIRRAAWWFPERFERLFQTGDPDELGIRTSLALMLVFVGIAQLLEIEGLLGAFMAGALFAFIFRNTGELEERISGFAYGFFIPIFFINVGVRFPLSELYDTNVLLSALGLIGIAIIMKLIPAMLLVFRRLSPREALASGVLLAGQLSVIIALAGFGVTLGVIDEGLAAGATLLVAVTAVLSPVVFRLLAPPLDAKVDEHA